MPLSASLLTRFASLLVSQAGGYLRNPIREPYVTCAVCTTPACGFFRCFQCHTHAQGGLQLADTVAPLFYAVPKTQSGYVMHGYKAQPRPIQEHRGVVTVATMVGVGLHSICVESLVGARISHWAMVPSLPAKPGAHPLRSLVAPAFVDLPEAQLHAAPVASDPRSLDAGHFSCPPLPIDAHVLLVDDTWARGGHAQSAVLALRAARARHVSVMVLARWLRLDFADNEKFVRDRLTRDYDPLICPWTGSACP
jgi:hypothetical protein